MVKVTTKEMQDKRTKVKVAKAIKKLNDLLSKDTPFRRMMVRLKDK